MRILLSAALAASFAAGSLPALAQTATTPVKEKACKTFKDEAFLPNARVALGQPRQTQRASARRLRSRKRRSLS